MKPQSISEWEIYINGLAGMPLWSKVVAANSQAFVDALLADGLRMFDVQQIMMLFVRQLRATGQKIPAGGAFDLIDLARHDIVSRKTVPVSDEARAELGMNPPSEDDGFEDTLAAMAAE